MTYTFEDVLAARDALLSLHVHGSGGVTLGQYFFGPYQERLRDIDPCAIDGMARLPGLRMQTADDGAVGLGLAGEHQTAAMFAAIPALAQHADALAAYLEDGGLLHTHAREQLRLYGQAVRGPAALERILGPAGPEQMVI
jgi:hypothetical protein